MRDKNLKAISGKIVDMKDFKYENFLHRVYSIDDKEKLYQYFKQSFSKIKLRYNEENYLEAFMILFSLIEDKGRIILICKIREYVKDGTISVRYEDMLKHDIIKKYKIILEVFGNDDLQYGNWVEGEYNLNRILGKIGYLNLNHISNVLYYFGVLSHYKHDFWILCNVRNNLMHNYHLNLNRLTKTNIDDTMAIYKLMDKELKKLL